MQKCGPLLRYLKIHVVILKRILEIELFSIICIKPGDYVMAAVINEFKEKCYVPGIVQSTCVRKTSKTYMVMYFNGIEGMNKRNEVIVITKNRYGLAADFIRNKLGFNQK
jgi:hypothetical protein